MHGQRRKAWPSLRRPRCRPPHKTGPRLPALGAAALARAAVAASGGVLAKVGDHRHQRLALACHAASRPAEGGGARQGLPRGAGGGEVAAAAAAPGDATFNSAVSWWTALIPAWQCRLSRSALTWWAGCRARCGLCAPLAGRSPMPDAILCSVSSHARLWAFWGSLPAWCRHGHPREPIQAAVQAQTLETIPIFCRASVPRPATAPAAGHIETRLRAHDKCSATAVRALARSHEPSAAISHALAARECRLGKQDGQLQHTGEQACRRVPVSMPECVGSRAGARPVRGAPPPAPTATTQLCRCPQAEAHARKLLTTTNLSAVLRPQHVVTIKDSASVDQTLRVRRTGERWCGRGAAAAAAARRLVPAIAASPPCCIRAARSTQRTAGMEPKLPTWQACRSG